MKKISLLITISILSMLLLSCSSPTQSTAPVETTTPTLSIEEITPSPTTPPPTPAPTPTPTEVPFMPGEHIFGNYSAMIIIGDDFGNTYFDMKTELENLGFTVTTVGVGSQQTLSSCPNHDIIEVAPDINITDITADNITNYAMVFIPAGKHHRTIPYNTDVKRVLNLCKDNAMFISSVCAGNIVLASVDGLIDGYAIASSSLTKSAIYKAGGTSKYTPVVVDRYFVTGSKGGGKSGDGHLGAPIKEMAETLKSLIDGDNPH